MLNYIWAGLIAIAMVFALVSDVQDIRQDTFANARPMRVTIKHRDLTGTRDAPVEISIDAAEYSQHFHSNETLAASYSATITKLEKGWLLRFDKDATLPPRLATMRDQTDTKQLQARLVDYTSPNSTTEAVQLIFDPVRFVKIRAITTAAIEMASTAVELSLKLIGVLALWLGLMKIGEAAGLIDIMVRIIQPILRPLFPQIPKGHPAMGYIAVNL